MAKTYEELLEQAAIIRDETAAGKNTATRVGGTITDAVDYVKELQDTYKGIHAEAAAAKEAAAAAKSTASEAKTNAGSARSIAQSAVLTANSAKATADGIAATAQEAKDLAEATKSELVEVVGSLGDEDNRLNGLIAENKAKIASVESTATQARDTAVSAQTAAENAQTAAEATKSELKAELNGKQDALTLTVKDNGNIVLANIQGQSKEFMPATPSGDPMHYAYVTAGAEYNDTGADIVKDAPWADMLDDDYDGPYGKTVVHKAGYWYLNGLGDITNEEIRKIYIASSNFPEADMRSYFGYVDFRTNFSGIRKISGWLVINAIAISDGSNKFSILNLSCLKGASINMQSLNNKIVHILGTYVVLGNAHNLSADKNLITAPFKKLMYNLNIGGSPVLSVKSVLYMVNNEKATSPITITLHADVYNRCMANADILAALEAHTNISLASA